MTANSITPLPWQARPCGAPEDVNLFLGGGRGGGKSFCGALLALQHCNRYRERARVLWVRGTHQANLDAEDDVEALFVAAYGAAMVHRNRQTHTISLTHGARVEFSNIDAASYAKFQGRQYSLIIADEVGAASSLRPIERLRSNLRVPGVPCRVIYLANPGGPQHTVLAKRHVHGRIPGVPYELDGETWISFPSVYTDNPHIDGERYARRIMASVGNDRALAAAWLTGDWSAVSGAFFADVYGDHLLLPDDEWRVPSTTTPGPALSPEYAGYAGQSDDDLPRWRSFVSLDWGWSAPSVALLCAQPLVPGLRGPCGRVVPVRSIIVLDELATADSNDPNSGLGWPPSMLAEEILVRCARWNVRASGCGDDARGLEGSSLLDQLRRQGLNLQRPQKDRISGWVRLKSMMAAAKAGDPDQPWLLIRERCRYLHETLPTLPRNELRPEDVDTRAADHGADALRYAAVHAASVGVWGAHVDLIY